MSQKDVTNHLEKLKKTQIYKTILLKVNLLCYSQAPKLKNVAYKCYNEFGFIVYKFKWS